MSHEIMCEYCQNPVSKGDAILVDGEMLCEECADASKEPEESK